MNRYIFARPPHVCPVLLSIPLEPYRVDSKMSFFSISPCCLKGTVLPGEPRGVYQPVSLADKRTAGRYYTTPQDGVKHPKVAILLYMDLFAFQIVSGSSQDLNQLTVVQPNGKILADLLADKLGVAVYVPDYIRALTWSMTEVAECRFSSQSGGFRYGYALFPGRARRQRSPPGHPRMGIGYSSRHCCDVQQPCFVDPAHMPQCRSLPLIRSEFQAHPTGHRRPQVGRVREDRRYRVS